MPDLSISRAITSWAEQRPDAVAVRCGDDVLTWRELDQVSNRVARRWRSAGLAVDDLVSVALPNSTDVVVACVAAWKAGATPQPLSPRLGAAERDAVLALAAPAVVVAGPLDRCDGESDAPLPDLAASSWKAPTSSGSTGRPKIVRAAAPARVDPEGRVAPFVPREAVQLVAGPLFHAAPFVYAMRGLMTGHELVVMPRFDADEWLRLVAEHQVTWGMLVPTMMQRIWRAPSRGAAQLDSLESVLHLGARCPAWLKRAWLEWLGPERVWELYAGTESQGLALIGGTEWLERPGSVGRPVGDSRFRVVRPDGSGCDPGEEGEVLMRRSGPTYAYVGAVPQVRDGWHTLGDSGHLDADGFLWIGDRLDDVVVTGGVKVQPADVEAVLDEHPAVRSSVVVGRDDDDLGQRVHAVVDTAGVAVGEAELMAWVHDRLDPEKQPRSWQVVSEELRSDTGKVRRSAWR
ncbi:AMP-binding protein [Nocardioides psychrotolerans]|uniref:AMP-binding protein n=1 Tax=Nocardioides psychrotolerans TaxID=1005945 RepID=UPI003138406A